MDRTRTLIDNRFEIGGPLAEGGMCFVHRGHDRETGRTVAVKILKEEALSRRLDDLVRFQAALEAVSHLDNPGVEKIVAWSVMDPGAGRESRYVVTELAPGMILADLLSAGRRFNADETLALAIQLSEALAAVHGAGICHSDIKPGNVVVDENGDSFASVLIDFGLARLRKGDEETFAAGVSGTYPYMSPEQAGIIRRPVDERSDLYSLGALLYEMLTGRPPFGGETLVKLLHALAAEVPAPPSSLVREIGPELDGIIMKLLEKEPERRYQSARGLLRDLNRVRDGERGFAIGGDDSPVRLEFAGEMAGRDKELTLLMERLREAAEGRGGAVFITGEAGIGKSRLAEEFWRRITEAGIPIAEGRATNRENRSPHGPFRDALSDYLRRYQRYEEVRREEIAAHMKREIGDLGRIIVDFEPEAVHIVGRCPDTVPLEPEREAQRFYLTMGNFFLELADAEHGMVILLDDLHWADGGTLHLLEEIVRRISGSPLLLVCVFRDEVDMAHPLKKIAGDAGLKGIIKELHLVPLDGDSMRHYLAGVLRVDDEALAAFACRSGAGNPLFIQEIVKGLVAEGILNERGGVWRIDRERLDRAEAPPTVVDALIRRVESFDEGDRALLSKAAVAGRSFDTNLLLMLDMKDDTGSGAVEERMRRIVAVIDRAAERQVLVKGEDRSGRVSFVHDRVRDAFYGLVPKKERRGFHGRMARAMETMYEGRHDDVLYDLAFHFIQAGDEEKILDYAYRAGLKARENYSYRDAIGYLTETRTILDKRYVKSHDEDVGNRFIRCTVLLAEMNLEIFESDIAIDLLNDVMPRMTGKEELNVAYLILTRAYLMKVNYAMSEEMARKGLAMLGERIPRTRTGHLLSMVTSLLAHSYYTLIRRVFPVSGKDLSGVSKKILKYFDWLWFVYNFNDSNKLAWLVLRRLVIAESMIGPSQELELCRMNYAQLLAMALPRGMKRPVRYRLEDLKIELDDRGLSSFYYLRGFLHYLRNDFSESIRDLKQCIEISERIGDAFMVYIVGLLVFLSYHLRAEYEEAKKAYDKSMRYAKNDFERLFVGGWSFPREHYIETGQYDLAERLLEEHKRKLFEFKMWVHYCYACGDYAYLHIEKGEPEKAFLLLAEANSLMKRYRLPEIWIPNYSTRYAQTLMADFMKKRNDMSPKERRRCLRAIKKACRIAIRKTRTVYNHFIAMVSYRLMAQYHVLEWHHAQAVRYFVKSIDIAGSVGRRYELARSLYEYGAFLKDRGDWPGAWERLTEAYLLFEEIGVTTYRERISRGLGIPQQSKMASDESMPRERMRYMVEQSAMITGCESLPDLLARVLSLSMELAGARNGWIFLYDDEKGILEMAASRVVDDTPDHDYSRHIVERVFDSGEPIVAADASADNELSMYRSVSGHELRSVACMPISHNELVDGAVYLDNPLAGGIFTGDTVRLLSMFLSNAAVLIENVLLRHRLELRKESEKGGASAYEKKIMGRAFEFIERNLGEEDLRDKLAGELGVGIDHLGRLLKKHTGLSLKEHIDEKRIRKAMDHLSGTDRKIIDIAYDSGFDSVRTFYRIFYRAAGMTPTGYRERHVLK